MDNDQKGVAKVLHNGIRINKTKNILTKGERE